MAIQSVAFREETVIISKLYAVIEILTFMFPNNIILVVVERNVSFYLLIIVKLPMLQCCGYI